MKTIFLHGLGQTPSDWDAITCKISASDVDCPDLFALVQGVPSYPALLDALEDRYAAEPESLQLCGLSLGGILALDYAIRNPDKVESLLLIGTPYKTPRLLMGVQNVLFRWMPDSAFSEMGISKCELLQLTHSMRTLDFTQKLNSIHCPVQIVCGEKDHANKRAAFQLHQLLPQSELHFIPGAGHEVNKSAPDALWKLLH